MDSITNGDPNGNTNRKSRCGHDVPNSGADDNTISSGYFRDSRAISSSHFRNTNRAANVQHDHGFTNGGICTNRINDCPDDRKHSTDDGTNRRANGNTNQGDGSTNDRANVWSNSVADADSSSDGVTHFDASTCCIHFRIIDGCANDHANNNANGCANDRERSHHADDHANNSTTSVPKDLGAVSN
jgi:hypothetical protein